MIFVEGRLRGIGGERGSVGWEERICKHFFKSGADDDAARVFARKTK